MSENRHKLLARQLRRHFPDGPPPEMSAFLDDVEDSYRQYDADRVLNERSVEISSEELYAKNRELESQNATLDSFIYRVSHDLKTPANNVIAMASMLKKRISELKPDPMTEQMLSHLENASQAMLVRLKDLLELTRIEKSLAVRPEAIGMASMLKVVLDNLQLDIDSTDAHFELDLRECPSIFIGRENLRSILDNLVGNALKYRSPDRRPEICISTRRHGPWALLEVKDNGLGIDLEKFGGKLFGMFNRFHSHVDGTGVGLYIVKKIAEASGGRVEVESEIGVGTTFKLYLAHQAVSAEKEHA